MSHGPFNYFSGCVGYAVDWTFLEGCSPKEPGNYKLKPKIREWFVANQISCRFSGSTRFIFFKNEDDLLFFTLTWGGETIEK